MWQATGSRLNTFAFSPYRVLHLGLAWSTGVEEAPIRLVVQRLGQLGWRFHRSQPLGRSDPGRSCRRIQQSTQPLVAVLFSNCVESQASPAMGMRSGCQGIWFRSTAFRMRSSLHMAATSATFPGLVATSITSRLSRCGRARKVSKLSVTPLIACDAARQRQCPTRQIAAVAQQVKLHVVGKPTAQGRNDVVIRGCAGSQPLQCLNHRCGRSSRPPHDLRARVSEPDGSSIYLEQPRVAVRHIADLRGHRVGEAQLMRGHQTVRHVSRTIPSCQCFDGGIQIDRNRLIQQLADPRHVIQAMAYPAQPSSPGQA